VSDEPAGATAHIVCVGGELDVGTAPAVEDTIARLIDEGRTHVVLDLTEATFLDSSALSSLLACSRRLRRPEGAMAVVIGTHAQPRARFDLTGTREVLNVCDSREEALSLVNRPRDDERGAAPAPAPLHLQLYINSETANARRAITAFEDLRRRHLSADAQVEVIDVAADPGAAERERLLAVPALIRVSPPPVRRIIGDLTDQEQVLWALDLALDRPV
jgi:anti-anti-sigma factor